jgi:hypothetical protein
MYESAQVLGGVEEPRNVSLADAPPFAAPWTPSLGRRPSDRCSFAAPVDPPRASAAAVDDDQVGDEANQETCREHQHAELAVAEAPHSVPDLADHV